MKEIILLICLFLIISCQPTATITTKNIVSEHEKAIDQLFTKCRDNQPGASVLVIKNGDIAFAKSYGFSDLERKVVATNSTNYRIASVTKQFTAAAILILVEEGKLSYETTLTDIFSDFPTYGKNITIQHLLTHRSGLIHYNNFIEEGQTEQLLDEDVLRGLMQTDSTYFPSGTEYKYSNSGYAVLAEIIAETSKMSFQKFMQKRIFQPLEMSNSIVFDINNEIKNRAYGYIVKDTLITFKDQSITSAIKGDGGVYTSILDYHKWDKSLMNNQLLKEKSLEDAFSAWNENGKTTKNGYGFGWQINTENDIKYLEHGGSTSGFGTHVIRVPEMELTAVIFTNRNKTGNDLRMKCKALLSFFSDGKILMPIEVLVKEEISKNGIDSALDLYDELKLEPNKYTNSKNALYFLAFSYFRSKKLTLAKALFEKTATEFPEFHGGFYGLAVTHQALENNDKTIEFFEKALARLPESEQGKRNYSKLQLDILKKL